MCLNPHKKGGNDAARWPSRQFNRVHSAVRVRLAVALFVWQSWIHIVHKLNGFDGLMSEFGSHCSPLQDMAGLRGPQRCDENL